MLLALVVALVGGCGADPSGEQPQQKAPAAPTSARSQVLTLSDYEVAPGQVVEVTFEPPPEHDVWGVDGELWQDVDGAWERIAWTSGWAGKPKMTTIWPNGDDVAFAAIGFGGKALWRWTVPERLEPGHYELRKEWLPKAPASPDRPVVTERAGFTVTE